jgi:hypothetical protein
MMVVTMPSLYAMMMMVNYRTPTAATTTTLLLQVSMIRQVIPRQVCAVIITVYVVAIYNN